MTNIKDFNPNLLKTDKNSYKNINIYYIRYITIKSISNYESINSVNPLYFVVAEVDGFIEGRNGNKYLVFASTDGNKEVLEKYIKLQDEIRFLIKKINGGKEGEYKKDFTKIKFNSDDNLPMGRIFKLHMLTIVVRSIFEEDGKYYLQVFLDECLHEVLKCKTI